MKKYAITTIAFLLLIIVSLSLGVTVGSLIYSYKILSGGVLGISTLILLYVFFVPPKDLVNPPKGMQVELPRDIKYIPLSFFITLTGTCALEYVIEFISSLS